MLTFMMMFVFNEQSVTLYANVKGGETNPDLSFKETLVVHNIVSGLIKDIL